MDGAQFSGGFSDPSVQSAVAFRALLSAMARPGRVERITGGQAPAPVSPAAATLFLTLCDAETPVFLGKFHNVPAVRDWIAFHIGAPICGPSEAMFALGTWDDLMPLDQFAIGTPDYPDRSATLIVETAGLDMVSAQLTGPGIQSRANMALPQVQAFQSNAVLFPLGQDFYFTNNDMVAALPRSTKVEAA